MSSSELSNETRRHTVWASFCQALLASNELRYLFRVTVSGEGANQGRSSGGQVTLLTKSGSNNFHGSLYEYNRNTATAANDWFSNRAGIARQPLVRNQFGASVGGRIIRDKLFFFANWENRIDASGQAVTRTVPSDTLRQGLLASGPVTAR